MEGLFSYITLELKKYILFNETSIDVTTVRNYIDRMYESNEDDIEDFYDLIILLNELVLKFIEIDTISNEKLKVIIKDCRIYAKKQVKRKYRDCKYNNRAFLIVTKLCINILSVFNMFGNPLCEL